MKVRTYISYNNIWKGLSLKRIITRFLELNEQ